MANRRNRRLSGMDLLPEIATPAIKGAVDALKQRRATVDHIYQDFCDRLDHLDVQRPSRTAFYRWAQRVFDGLQGEAIGDYRRGGFLSIAADRLRLQAEQLEMTARHLRMLADEISNKTVGEG